MLTLERKKDFGGTVLKQLQNRNIREEMKTSKLQSEERTILN